MQQNVLAEEDAEKSKEPEMSAQGESRQIGENYRGKKVKKNESFGKRGEKSITLRIPSHAVLLASFIFYLAMLQ